MLYFTAKMEQKFVPHSKNFANKLFRDFDCLASPRPQSFFTLAFLLKVKIYIYICIYIFI